MSIYYTWDQGRVGRVGDTSLGGLGSTTGGDSGGAGAQAPSGTADQRATIAAARAGAQIDMEQEDPSGPVGLDIPAGAQDTGASSRPLRYKFMVFMVANPLTSEEVAHLSD